MANRIGIDLGGTKISALMLNAEGETLKYQRVDTPQNDYEGIIGQIASLVAQFEADGGDLARVGIGTPGSVSPVSGLMRNCNSTCLNGRPFIDDLSKRLARPVQQANDADCFALSEATDGAAAGSDSVFGVIIGTGCGGGVVINGRLLSGPNRIAGEWGHNTVPLAVSEGWPDRPCYCGRVNCVETFVSGPGLAQSLKRWAPHFQTAKALSDAVEAGDKLALQARDSYAMQLAECLSVVINILDPQRVVLGGGVSLLPGLPEALTAALQSRIFSESCRTQIVTAMHGSDSGVRGAAWL